MVDIEIKRGYEVLSDNNVRFGIRVINNSSFAIMDVEVILDYSEDSFKLQGDRIHKFGTIPPSVPRTAKFVLQPKGCIHKDELAATVLYKDHEWNKHIEQMRSKEVHCVCPFLKEKSISRAEFLTLSKSGYSAESGVNFENIDSAKVVDFLSHTCKNRLYKVDEFPVDGGNIIYMAGDAVGEKAYYLLTAVVKEHEGLTQVFLRANSDKDHGLTGFLNETLDNLRHLVVAGKVREIGVIKKEQVINIIDSVVQRTTFGGVDGEGSASVNIQDSVVQRTEFYVSEGKKVEEDGVRKAQTERRVQEKQKDRTEQESIAKKKSKTRTIFFMLAIVLGALLVGFAIFAPGSDNSLDVPPSSTQPEKVTDTHIPEQSPEVTASKSASTAANNYVPERSTPYPFQSPNSNQKTYTNSIGMELVLMPAGEFDMGSPSDEEGMVDWEAPVHKVKISYGFYLGKYEVTQKQWRQVMGDIPSYYKGDDRPVEQVSWDDAQEFIKKLNQKEGTDKYRLPSEAEWEYAARAGTTTRYSFGNSESMLGEYAWYRGNSGTHPVDQIEINGNGNSMAVEYIDTGPHQVGQKKPNPWGLYDMHCNVAERVQDKYHDYNGGTPSDGSAWESGDDQKRVSRGGSWSSSAQGCRSALRNGGNPHVRDSTIGFRLLRDM